MDKSSNGQQTSSASSILNANDRISNLVDTFAGDVDSMDSKTSAYQVNSQVGVMIAQKLQGGERLRVGRNGKEVLAARNTQDPFQLNFKRGFLRLYSSSTHSIQLFSSQFIFLSRDSKLFDERPKSILSWEDQVKKEDVRIIEPTISPEKEEMVRS